MIEPEKGREIMLDKSALKLSMLEYYRTLIVMGKGKFKKRNRKTSKDNRSCDCGTKSTCDCRGEESFFGEVDRFLADLGGIGRGIGAGGNVAMSFKNSVPSIISDSHRSLKPIVMKNTMSTIERLYAPTNGQARGIYGSEEGLYPASYGGPIGPKCNWRKCSNKGGCGTECTCHPAGWYGWRCVPDCCIGTNGSPPCRYKYNAHVQCTLPCHTWPGLCQQNFWNPYHQFQGPLQYPKSYGPALNAVYG